MGDKFTPMQVVGAVAMYWVISISMVFLNKTLMTGSAATIPAPLFITFCQCVTSVGICWAAGEIGVNSAPGTFFAQFQRVRPDPAKMKKMLPLTLAFVGMVSFNNLCLKLVEVSFYQVARGLTILFNVIFSYMFLQQPTSMRTLVCLAVVVAGFWMGTEGEVRFSLLGSVFGVAASMCVAWNSIATKQALDLVNGDKAILSTFANMNACILFPVLILLAGEWDILVEHSEKLFMPTFWFLTFLSGVFGFSIGIAVMYQIQATSPLSHSISGTVKAAVQSLMAFWIYGNPTTAANVLGIFLVLGGSLLYTMNRMKEQDATKAAAMAFSAKVPSPGAASSGSPTRANSP